ncbi:hypothetical protein Tco_0795327 [Tanacetum coccineum]
MGGIGGGVGGGGVQGFRHTTYLLFQHILKNLLLVFTFEYKGGRKLWIIFSVGASFDACSYGDEVPEETFLESFNHSIQVAFSIVVEKTNVGLVQDVIWRTVATSHMPPSLKRRISRPIPNLAISGVMDDANQPGLSLQSCRMFGAFSIFTGLKMDVAATKRKEFKAYFLERAVVYGDTWFMFAINKVTCSYLFLKHCVTDDENGILLMLQHCVTDDENPFSRSVNLPEFARMGLRVDVDPQKLKCEAYASVEYERVVMNPTCLRLPAATVGKTFRFTLVEFQRISLTGFRAALAILDTGASQSRQHSMNESASYYLTD